MTVLTYALGLAATWETALHSCTLLALQPHLKDTKQVLAASELYSDFEIALPLFSLRDSLPVLLITRLPGGALSL